MSFVEKNRIPTTQISVAVKAIKAGDQDGIREFVESITPLVRRIASNYEDKHGQNIDDLIQDSLITICRDLKHFKRSKSSFTTWCTMIVKRQAINQYRKKDCRLEGNSIPLSLLKELSISEEGIKELSPLEKASIAEERSVVIKIMEAVSKEYPDYYDAYRLTELEGKTRTQAAAAMHKSPEQISCAKFQFKEKVKRKLQECEEDMNTTKSHTR